MLSEGHCKSPTPVWIGVELRLREALLDVTSERCFDFASADASQIVEALASSEVEAIREFSRECRDYLGRKEFEAAVAGAKNRLRSVVIGNTEV